MPVETADDLASFFDDGEFAESATWTGTAPGSDPVPCSVIVDRGQGRSRFDRGRPEAVGSDRLVFVRRHNPQDDGSVIEIAPVRGSRFAVSLDADDPDGGTELLQVDGTPVLDETARVWTCDVLQVAV